MIRLTNDPQDNAIDLIIGAFVFAMSSFIFTENDKEGHMQPNIVDIQVLENAVHCSQNYQFIQLLWQAVVLHVHQFW